MKIFKYGALAFAVTLTACGGGGSSSGGGGEPSTSSETGVFTDSPVAGIQYRTNPGNKSGKTSALGEYNYVEGDTVTFSIGDTDLPSIAASGRVTPADMADGNDADVVINVLRLLQTLDDDGNPDNGISISQQTLDGFIGKDVEVNQPAAAFETEAETAIGGTLVTSEEAEAHFADSQQADLRGSWLVLEGPSERNVLTFLEGDRYILSHSYGNEDQGAATAEWGTYDWDPVTGDIVFALEEESDGQGGLAWAGDGVENDQVVSANLVFSGDELNVDLGDGDTFSASPIKDPNNPLVGAWYLAEEEGFNVLTILDDSHYTVAHSSNQEGYGDDEPVAVSSEWGTYQLNGDAFDPVATVETDGEGGLYNKDLVGDLSGPYYSMTLEKWGDLNFIEHHPEIGDNPFSLSRIGRFAVELRDLAENSSTAVVERGEEGFFEGMDAAFSLDLVGEDDKVNIHLNSNGTGRLTFSPGTEDQEPSTIDAPWQATTSGTLVFTETMEDGSTGRWTLAPVKNRDADTVIVDFRHIDGGTESPLGFFISDLASPVAENEPR
ncbi:hypothetical protein LL252_03380 [Alcanivorax marinus]|uniref:Uncharacterized protein n=1 Tax=Alloalcanivorax marinus TaxID=1177169 RepID=A0A9Q3YLA3_9GAMM|nr:hypothetical protein [Alloalcanivorax marinus]MCC4307604.1 hypothetical protein [Alloalcanivorax marinus]